MSDMPGRSYGSLVQEAGNRLTAAGLGRTRQPGPGAAAELQTGVHLGKASHVITTLNV